MKNYLVYRKSYSNSTQRIPVDIVEGADFWHAMEIAECNNPKAKDEFFALVDLEIVLTEQETADWAAVIASKQNQYTIEVSITIFKEIDRTFTGSEEQVKQMVRSLKQQCQREMDSEEYMSVKIYTYGASGHLEKTHQFG